MCDTFLYNRILAIRPLTVRRKRPNQSFAFLPDSQSQFASQYDSFPIQYYNEGSIGRQVSVCLFIYAY